MHTVIFTPRSQEELAAQTSGNQSSLDVLARISMMLPRAPAVPLEAWILFLVWTLKAQLGEGGEQWGKATSIPTWTTEDLAASSLETGNTGPSQPPQGARVSP